MTIGLSYANAPIAKPAPKIAAIVLIAPTKMPSVHQPPVPSVELEATSSTFHNLIFHNLILNGSFVNLIGSNR